MAAARIKGVLSPVVTPFKRDLSPDVGRFIAHCKWLLSQDCGLAVFGTNSEANSMSAKERMGLLDAIVAAGVPTDRMMPGTGACSINEAAEVSALAEQGDWNDLQRQTQSLREIGRASCRERVYACV